MASLMVTGFLFLRELRLPINFVRAQILPFSQFICRRRSFLGRVIATPLSAFLAKLVQRLRLEIANRDCKAYRGGLVISRSFYWQ